MLAVALPSLQFGFNQVAFARRVTRYFVVPLGLAGAGASHSGHGSVAVTASSLLGLLCMVAAEEVKRLVVRKRGLTAIGCVLMLAAAIAGRTLERKQTKKKAQEGKCCDKC